MNYKSTIKMRRSLYEQVNRLLGNRLSFRYDGGGDEGNWRRN